MQPGPLGILQPPRDHWLAPETLDMLLVPGVGFDLSGRRLGYGGGFYDRYLANFRGITLGLAYDLQILNQLPAEAHDQLLQMLLTESRILHFI